MMRRLAGQEEGAVAVIVAISLIMFFALGAIAVDLGGQWAAKRELIPDLDAAALAVAGDIAGGAPSCAAAEASAVSSGTNARADQVLGFGGDAIRTADVAVACVGSAGAVRVDGLQGSETTFSPFLGRDELGADGSSFAQFGPAQTGTGLRPFGVCKDDPSVVDWIAADDPKPSGVEIRWFFDANDTLGPCGGAAGNRGLVCFVGNCGNSEVLDMIINGYSGEVDLGPAGAGQQDCDPEQAGLQDCESKPGCSVNPFRTALEELEEDGTEFAVLLYDEVKTPGRADYHPWGFLGVKIVGYKLTMGACETARWIDFELTTLQLEGSVGTGPSTGVTAMNLCGADRDPAGTSNCVVTPG